MDSYWKELLLIKEILSKHPRGITISELSRKLQITRNSLSKYLDVLLSTGQIEMRRIGSAKLYFISERVPLSALLYLYSYAMVVLDEDGTIVFANDPFLKIAAASPERILRKEITMLDIPPLNDPQILSALETNPQKPLDIPNLMYLNRGEEICLRAKVCPTVLERGAPGTSILFEDVTRQVRVDEDLRESRERYRLLVENSPDMIAIHDGKQHLFINPAGLRLLGAETPADVLGRPITQFLDPDSCDIVRARVEQLQSSVDAIPPAEMKLLRLDGTTITVESLGHTFVHRGRTLMQIVIRDITERKQMEDALRTSEARVRALLNAPQESALLVDREGIILALNEVAAARFGENVGDLTGRQVETLLPPDLAAARRGLSEMVFASGRPLNFSDERDGMIFDNTHYPVRDARGDVQQIAVFARDVTQQRNLEKARKQACDRIQESVDALTIQSDNIRQPLQVILGLADLMDDEETGERIRQQVRRINMHIKEIDLGREEFCGIREALRSAGSNRETASGEMQRYP